MDDADYYTKSGALGFSTGLNVRYSILMIGFEYNTISPGLENRDHPGVYLGNVNDIGSDKSPLPSVNFTLGLSF